MIHVVLEINGEKYPLRHVENRSLDAWKKWWHKLVKSGLDTEGKFTEFKLQEGGKFKNTTLIVLTRELQYASLKLWEEK